MERAKIMLRDTVVWSEMDTTCLSMGNGVTTSEKATVLRIGLRDTEQLAESIHKTLETNEDWNIRLLALSRTRHDTTTYKATKVPNRAYTAS